MANLPKLLKSPNHHNTDKKRWCFPPFCLRAQQCWHDRLPFPRSRKWGIKSCQNVGKEGGREGKKKERKEREKRGKKEEKRRKREKRKRKREEGDILNGF